MSSSIMKSGLSALVVDRLTKKLGDVDVLDSVSLEVMPGETVALVGPNGAGKTTLFRSILGLLKPDSGSISLLGRPSGSPRSRKSVGFCLDGDGLYQSLDSLENLEFFRIAYGAGHPIHHYSSLLGVDDFGKRPVSQYSRGMKKRLALARAMICSPQLLLLDEPLLGLDPDGQHELIEFLRKISDGRAVLISSHDLSAVESFCDRIVVLNQRVLFDGHLEQFRVRGVSMYSAYRSILEGERS